MKKLTFLLAIIGTVFVPLVYGAPAQAQATRTWVSGVGDDANPCSRTAPCKTFAGAYSKTAVAGEINVLDPGGFGAVTISKSLTISSERFEAGVLVSGTNGIIVNLASTDSVRIRGLDIEGLGTGLDGIKLIQAGTLYVENCTIHHFSSNGINIAPTGATNVFVTDTIISDNTNSGIQVTPTMGPNVEVVVDHTRIYHNHDGVIANGASGATTRVQLIDSDASGNTAGSGVTAQTGAQATSVFVKNSLLGGNGTGAIASGANAAVLLSGNTITNNGTAASSVSGGTLFSYKNNDINDNGSPGSALTPVLQQ